MNLCDLERHRNNRTSSVPSCTQLSADEACSQSGWGWAAACKTWGRHAMHPNFSSIFKARLSTSQPDILLEAIHEQGRADACASHGEERHERTWLHGASCKGTRQVGVNTNVVATWSLHTHPVGPSTVANAIDGVITTVAIAGAIQSCTHRICFGTLFALSSAPLPCSENGRVRACESKRRHGGGGRRR